MDFRKEKKDQTKREKRAAWQHSGPRQKLAHGPTPPLS
jgi:hypothetical protein